MAYDVEGDAHLSPRARDDANRHAVVAQRADPLPSVIELGGLRWQRREQRHLLRALLDLVERINFEL
jgi:hypothetical protein